MKLSELPTSCLRALVARCEGYDVAGGDHRIVLKAVVEMCLREIDRRLSGGDFPELGEAAAAATNTQITSCSPGEFMRLLFELDA